MNVVDLNCDLGESFGIYKIGLDEQIIPLISSANIACGYHAADPVVIDNTVALAAKYSCSIGAHVGLPDIMGFGRRNMGITQEEAKVYVIYQIGALYAFCEKYHVKLHHVKPHGALYNMAAVDYSIAKGICEGIREFSIELPLLALANSQMVKAASDSGIPVAQEVFADRAYNEDGTLVSRKNPGAVIAGEDEAAERVLGMVKEGRVRAITGRDIAIQADSVCVHGDNEKALLFVKKIRETLRNAQILIQSF